MEKLLETAPSKLQDDKDFHQWELQFSQRPEYSYTDYLPEIITARERATLFIGQVATANYVELGAYKPSQNIESLCDAIKQVKAGSQQALKMIETNVRTDLIERTLKSGHICSPVPLTFTEDARLIQFSQTLESVMVNTLRYASENPVMRQRAEAEASNNFLIEELYKSGFFTDNNLVIFSPAEDLPEYGFFTKTMSCSIQVISGAEGGLELTTALVAGVSSPGGRRHDLDAIGLVGDRLGNDLHDKTPAQIIGNPIMVNKSLMPNGAVSAVEWYDDALGGVFFGENKVRKDYRAYAKECQKREAKYERLVRTISDSLVEQSSKVGSPQDACRLLDELSGQHTIELAGTDTQIDPWVFGPKSASYIEHARYFYAQGDFGEAQYMLSKAKEHDQSSSCPISFGIKPDRSATSNTNQSDESCEFVSKKCPKCGTKNVKTTVTSREIRGGCGCKSKLNK